MPKFVQRIDGRRGFTVIEVLAVIAILGVLAGVLVPAIGRVRNTAQRALCLSNIKSIVTAIQAYATEHNDTIPYGPTAPPPSPSNLYPVTGLVTSQLSLSDGRPVALGLLLADHLGNQPSILFCPGADQPIDAQASLAKVGTRQAISGYYYRHGSNTLATAREPRSSWADRITLGNLGRNNRGQPIRALVVDQNFLTGVPLAAFGIVNRTNHRQEWVNGGFADGHAAARNNKDREYTVDVGNFPFSGPDMILDVFEKLDSK